MRMFEKKVYRQTNKNQLFDFIIIIKPMEELENKAIIELANIEGEEEEEFPLFQPYRSIAISQKPKSTLPDGKHKTLYLKQKTTQVSSPQSTRRDMLKKQLLLLQEPKVLAKNVEEEEQTKRRVQTATASCIRQQPVLGLVGDRFNKYNGFPAHPIKKQPERMWTLKKLDHKENSGWEKTQMQDLIRLDIKKKFQIRQYLRQTDRIAKINNFLKMVSTPKTNATAVGFRNQQKIKKTLNNLLS